MHGEPHYLFFLTPCVCPMKFQNVDYKYVQTNLVYYRQQPIGITIGQGFTLKWNYFLWNKATMTKIYFVYQIWSVGCIVKTIIKLVMSYHRCDSFVARIVPHNSLFRASRPSCNENSIYANRTRKKYLLETNFIDQLQFLLRYSLFIRKCPYNGPFMN